MTVEYVNFNDDQQDDDEYQDEVPTTWHLPERLYMVVITEYPRIPYNPNISWEDYYRVNVQRDHSADTPAFHWPSKNRVYRSRSSAHNKLRQFTTWGAKGYLVECTPTWESIPEANARRAHERTLKGQER